MKKLFTKIKFDGSKVRLEYQVTRKDGGVPDEHVVVCSDQPDRAFPLALAALALDVVGICELPGSDESKLLVRGVSMSYTDGIRGACITALKSLKTSNAPLVLNTPYLPEKSYGEGDGPTLDSSTVSRIDALVVEAERYLAGERAQGKLFTPDTEQAVA